MCEYCGKPIYGTLCDSCKNTLDKVKHLKDNTREFFDNNFDCYTESYNDIECYPTSFAMSFEKF